MNKDELKEIIDEQILIGGELLRAISKNQSTQLARNITFFRGKTIEPDSLRKEIARDVNFLTRFLPFWAGYLKTDFESGQKIFAFLAHFYASFAFEPRERAASDLLFSDANEAWARVVRSYVRRDYEQNKIDVVDFLGKVLALGGSDALDASVLSDDLVLVESTRLGKSVTLVRG